LALITVGGNAMSDVERRDVLIGSLGLATAALAATEPAAAGDASFMNNIPDPLQATTCRHSNLPSKNPKEK
jgi:hypothetical protein